MDSRVLPSAKKLCGGQPRGTSGVGRTPVRPVPTECPKLIVDILGFLEGHRKVAIIGQEHHPVRPGLPAVRGVRRGQRAYVLNWLFKARGSGHAPDSIAAPSGTSANSHDRCRYALVMSFAQTLMHYKLGHHPMGGKFFRNHINFHHAHYSKDHLVSRTYLGNEGNNTPFFFIPVFLVGACTYLVLPVDLFVAQLVACAASFYAHVFFDKEYHIEGSRLQRFAWFRRKQELHFVHHRHANSNFAVIHFFWDRILGTYRRPDAAQTQVNGTLRIGGPARFPPFERTLPSVFHL